jgi:hypothetical protein
VYQGQLGYNGVAANGTFDFQFSIYDSTNNPGILIVGPLTNSTVVVSNGLFTAQLDFGSGVFTGLDRWLQIAVRTNGAAMFTNLSPRQQLTPVPYAIFANTASNLLGSLDATQLTGTLPISAFAGYTNTVALTNGANLFSGTFSGNGTNLVDLNASQLTGGTVADARLSTNVALLDTNQTFTGTNIFTGVVSSTGTNIFTGVVNFTGTNTFTGINTFTNLGNSFSGSFFGNGLVGWIATNGTAVQAQSDRGYLLTNSQIVTVTLPTAPNAGDIVRITGAGVSGWQIAENTGQSVLGNFLSYGTTWTQSGALAENWTSIASSSDGSKLAATANGGNIYVSADSGKTWNGTTPGGISNPKWIAIASSADGSRLVALNYGGSLYTSTNSGSTWTANTVTGVTSTNWYCAASSADGNTLVAAVYGGNIYTNSGTTWNAVGGTSGLNWISIASSADGSKLVAAVNSGSIYISSNSGKTWTPVNGTSGKDWESVASSSDGSKLAAAINNASSGGIYTSTNSGANWTQTSAPAKTWLSIASSADGSKLAVVSTNSGIYTSGNWGITWQQQTNGVPSAPFWESIASSADGSELAAVIFNSATGGIYTSQSSLQTISTTVTSGYITGTQGSAVELQYIGNGQFMPVSSVGTIWAH